VRLERTIVTDDDGRQVHVSDVWRSTDGRAHTISPHYDQRVGGTSNTGQTGVGLKLPWLSGAYRPFTGDVLFHGPVVVPASIFVRDEIAAPEQDTDFPQGAISFDVAPTKVHRGQYNNFTLRDENIKVPAGGTALVRQDFVIGTTRSKVTAKAAANEKQFTLTGRMP
jgi:hypothetical protein